MFDAIRQMKDDPNYIDANLLLRFPAFYDKEYRRCARCFCRSGRPSATTVRWCLYYVANIYYALGQKDKALNMQKANSKEVTCIMICEMRQIVGHAYFEKRNMRKHCPTRNLCDTSPTSEEGRYV